MGGGGKVGRIDSLSHRQIRASHFPNEFCPRELKNAWFQKKAKKAEQYSQAGNPREFYATLNAVYGPRSRSSHPVCWKDGVLLSGHEEIKDRWV